MYNYNKCGDGARRMTPNHIDIGQNTFEKFKFKEFTLSLTIGSMTHTVKPPYRSFPPPPPPLKTADDPHGHSATLMTPPLCANSIISSLPMTEESGSTTKHWRWLSPDLLRPPLRIQKRCLPVSRTSCRSSSCRVHYILVAASWSRAATTFYPPP